MVLVRVAEGLVRSAVMAREPTILAWAVMVEMVWRQILLVLLLPMLVAVAVVPTIINPLERREELVVVVLEALLPQQVRQGLQILVVAEVLVAKVAKQVKQVAQV